MKNNLAKLARKPEAKRDPVETFLLWNTIGSVTVLALCVFVLSPAAYIVLMGMLVIIATVGITASIAIALLSDGGFFSFLIAQDVIKGGFEVVGMILLGMASVSE